MKRIFLVLATAAFLTACSDAGDDNKETIDAEKQATTEKEKSKLEISVGKDSAGITTRNGSKVELGKESGGVENEDVKVKVKRDTN